MPESIYFLQDLALILLSAAVCGHLCHRVNLSPVVGYLVAGLILGTPQITFPYVSDEARINVIGQLGVVFLMFGIGLQLQLRRLRELGPGVLLATVITALLVLTIARAAAAIGGLSEMAGLFLAGIFMVSSSAVIGKVLQERGLGHFRFGRVALGMTLLEDVVAVVIALVTTLVSPLLMAHAEGLSRFLDSPRLARMHRIHARYVAFLQRVGGQVDRHVLWKLLRRRVFQIGREILLVSALLLFAEPIRSALLNGTQLPALAVNLGLGPGLGLICLLLLVAVWRNLSVCALMMTDYLRPDAGPGRRLAGALSSLLYALFALLLGLWLWNLLPGEYFRGWSLLVAVALAVAAVALAWRPMVRWQSQMELALSGEEASTGSGLISLGRNAGWDFNAEEFTLPDNTRACK